MRHATCTGLFACTGICRALLLVNMLWLSLHAQAESNITASATPFAPRIAIVIDDLGDRWAEGKAIINLPGAITVGIIPFTPHAIRLGALAHRNDKELMLHLPMEAIEQRYLGKAGLHSEMSQARFIETLYSGLEAIPHIRGVNNHMGSRLTQDAQRMNWLMAGLLRYGELYFVDSRTTHHSVALQQAHDVGLDSTARDVFLDHDRAPENIHKQWRYLLRVARDKGSALAIGHPYPETITFLQIVLPELEATGVKLVPVSELIAWRKTDRRLAWQTNPSSSPSPRAAKNSKP